LATEEATLILRIKALGRRSFSIVTGGLKAVARGTLGAIKALGAYGASVVALAGKASKFDEVKRSFTSLAAAQGKDADQMIAKLQDLSKGTVSNLNLMKSANTALLLGLPVERFGEMLNIARSASKATGESMQFMLQSIVTGLGRGSKLILDNLGIVFDVTKAQEEYAKSLGKTAAELTEAEKKQAFINKALSIGSKNAAALGGGTISLADRFEQLVAKFDNATISIGQNLAPAFSFLIKQSNKMVDAAEALAASPIGRDLFKDATKGIQILITGFKDFGLIVGGVLGTATAAIIEFVSGNFVEAGEILKNNFASLNEDLATNHREMREGFAEIDREFDAADLERQTELNNAKARGEEQFTKTKLAEEKKRLTGAQKFALANAKFQKFLQSEEVRAFGSVSGQIATLQGSRNKTLNALGSAAAKAQIIINTAQGISEAFKLGPFLGPILAPIVVAAGVAQLVAVNGARLADGGIVPATVGGIPAIIGEGGRDEAVIPLEDGSPAGGIGSTTVNITVMGGMLGDEASAREFAVAVDERLLELRQSGESVAFDERVT